MLVEQVAGSPWYAQSSGPNGSNTFLSAAYPAGKGRTHARARRQCLSAAYPAGKLQKTAGLTFEHLSAAYPAGKTVR